MGKGMEPVSTYPDGGGSSGSWSRWWGQALSLQFYRVAQPPEGAGACLPPETPQQPAVFSWKAPPTD